MNDLEWGCARAVAKSAEKQKNRIVGFEVDLEQGPAQASGKYTFPAIVQSSQPKFACYSECSYDRALMRPCDVWEDVC